MINRLKPYTAAAAAVAMLASAIVAPLFAQTQQLTGYKAPPGFIVALQSNVAACPKGAQIVSFTEPTLQLDGVVFRFTPNPPVHFAGGAAVAALYAVQGTNGQAQGQFCIDGACLANGNNCSAIAFIQPNTVRIYTRQ